MAQMPGDAADLGDTVTVYRTNPDDPNDRLTGIITGMEGETFSLKNAQGAEFSGLWRNHITEVSSRGSRR